MMHKWLWLATLCLLLLFGIGLNLWFRLQSQSVAVDVTVQNNISKVAVDDEKAHVIAKLIGQTVARQADISIVPKLSIVLHDQVPHKSELIIFQPLKSNPAISTFGCNWYKTKPDTVRLDVFVDITYYSQNQESEDKEQLLNRSVENCIYRALADEIQDAGTIAELRTKVYQQIDKTGYQLLNLQQ